MRVLSTFSQHLYSEATFERMPLLPLLAQVIHTDRNSLSCHCGLEDQRHWSQRCTSCLSRCPILRSPLSWICVAAIARILVAPSFSALLVIPKATGDLPVTLGLFKDKQECFSTRQHSGAPRLQWPPFWQGEECSRHYLWIFFFGADWTHADPYLRCRPLETWHTGDLSWQQMRHLCTTRCW